MKYKEKSKLKNSNATYLSLQGVEDSISANHTVKTTEEMYHLAVGCPSCFSCP